MIGALEKVAAVSNDDIFVGLGLGLGLGLGRILSSSVYYNGARRDNVFIT